MAIGGATGAAKGLENLDALRRELRAIKYDGVLDEAGIAKGHADAFLPLLSHSLFFYSRHLAQYLADKGYNAAAKNDVRMVEGVFKMLREDFEYQPTVKVSQFFGGGFAQAKVSFVCDVIRLCKNKHQMLWKKHRDARIKVETKGYRPNARLQPTKPPIQPAATPTNLVPKRKSGTKSGSTQRHKTVQSQPSTGQVLRAALTSVATPAGPLGPVGFGLNSVPGQPARTLPPQMMSSTQPQHLVDLHATSAYVDEFDCEDALNETHELPTSQPHILDSSGPARLTAQPTAMVPTLSQTEQLGRLGGSLRLESGGDVAPPVPVESTYAQQHQVPPARPAEPPAVAVGSTLTKEDLIDFADQMKSLVSGLESRLGMFEERIDGSISELQAKVTLIEGRLKFVERAPVAGGVASASVLSAASAPASPMKEPDTTTAQSARHVEYKPAAFATPVKECSQPKDQHVSQTTCETGDSHDDTLEFVEAVAARFSEARQYLVDSAAQQQQAS